MSNTEKELELVKSIQENTIDVLKLGDKSLLGDVILKLLYIEGMRLQVEALRLEHDLEKDIEGGGKDAEKEDNNG